MILVIIANVVTVILFVFLVISFLLVNRSWYKKSIEINRLWNELTTKNNKEWFKTSNAIEDKLYELEHRMLTVEYELKNIDGGTYDSNLQDSELPIQ